MRILVSGVGSPGGPGILKELRKDSKLKILGIDASEMTAGSEFVNKFIKVPRGDDPLFIEATLDICKEEKVEFYIPLVTNELEPLSEHKAAFKEIGTNIICSENDAMKIVNNKANLHSYFKNEENLIPQFKIVKNAEEIDYSLKELGYPENEVVMRLSKGNGTRGFRIITNKRDKFNCLFYEKPSNTFLTKSELLEITINKSLPELIFSEFLPGIEVTVDSLISSGVVRTLFARTRNKISNGISVSGEFIDSHEIKDKVEKIASEIGGLYGPIGFQFKKDRINNFKLLEINPRLQGASVATKGLGVNFPLEVLRMATDKKFFKPKESGVEVGFTRYWDEIFYEIK